MLEDQLQSEKFVDILFVSFILFNVHTKMANGNKRTYFCIEQHLKKTLFCRNLTKKKTLSEGNYDKSVKFLLSHRLKSWAQMSCRCNYTEDTVVQNGSMCTQQPVTTRMLEKITTGCWTVSWGLLKTIKVAINLNVDVNGCRVENREMTGLTVEAPNLHLWKPKIQQGQ